MRSEKEKLLVGRYSEWSRDLGYCLVILLYINISSNINSQYFLPIGLNLPEICLMIKRVSIESPIRTFIGYLCQ